MEHLDSYLDGCATRRVSVRAVVKRLPGVTLTKVPCVGYAQARLCMRVAMEV
jgi:hypothetical protein